MKRGRKELGNERKRNKNPGYIKQDSSLMRLRVVLVLGNSKNKRERERETQGERYSTLANAKQEKDESVSMMCTEGRKEGATSFPTLKVASLFRVPPG